MSIRILSNDEYSNLYNFGKNKWKGPCTKNTRWCFYEKYKTPNYGHLYNKNQFECCNKHLIYLLKKLCDASKKYNFKFFLDWGSLMGCLRNGKMIPYDVDIDIGICEEDLCNFKNSLNYLCNNGEQVRQNGAEMIIYQLSSINSIHIDIFIFNKQTKNNKILYIGNRNTPNSYFLKEDLFPLKKINFENMEVLIPNKSREYLERNYGKGCIENPITKHCYINDYVKRNGTNGDLPDKNTWNRLLRNKKD
jgi:hypothetical protein